MPHPRRWRKRGAGEPVLVAAGGHIDDLAGMPLRCGKRGFENPDFVVRDAD
jgi:3'-phosphoadenosine 5'-phosphosulfate (PAPS) 3'-phosphatase